MSDDPVRTWVRTGSAGWCTFQEFMIREGAAGLVEGLEYRGAEQARPSEQALEAIARARAIVIGPSNPLASIAPILAVAGINEALRAATAPVVAVSPIVGGEVLKGPTASFMAFAALELQRRRRGRLLRRAARRDRRRRRRRTARDAADRHAHGRRAPLAHAWPSRRFPSPRLFAVSRARRVRLAAAPPRSARRRRAARATPGACRALPPTDAFEERVTVVGVRQRHVGDVHLEELAQRLPAFADLPHEQPLGRHDAFDLLVVARPSARSAASARRARPRTSPAGPRTCGRRAPGSAASGGRPRRGRGKAAASASRRGTSSRSCP